MSQMLLNQLLDKATQLVALGLMAALVALSRVVATHFKNKIVADAFASLAALAAQIVSGAAHSAALSTESGVKPSPSALGLLALATLRSVGSQAIANLVAHGGLTQQAVDAALQAMIASAAVQLNLDAGTSVVVASQLNVSGK